MIKLLRIEWLKLRKYRAVIILLGLFVLSVFGINFIFYKTLNAVSEFSVESAPGGTDLPGMFLGQPFDFPMAWHTVSYLSTFLLIIPGLLIILLTANEYTFRTHRQSVINGLSRTQFITAKIGLIFTIGIGLTMLVAIIALLFGLSGNTGFSLEGLEYMGYFFVQTLSYMSVAFVIVMLFRRSGVGIGIYFLYAFIIENLISLILNIYVSDGIGNYLPIKAADKLILAPTSIGKMFNPNPPDTTHMLIASLVWIGLCLWFCIHRFRKSDL